MRDLGDRMALIDAIKNQGIQCVFHYVPLHSAPQGRIGGRAMGALTVTSGLADRLVRLPLWVGLGDMQKAIIDHALTALREPARMSMT